MKIWENEILPKFQGIWENTARGTCILNLNEISCIFWRRSLFSKMLNWQTYRQMNRQTFPPTKASKKSAELKSVIWFVDDHAGMVAYYWEGRWWWSRACGGTGEPETDHVMAWFEEAAAGAALINTYTYRNMGVIFKNSWKFEG